MISTVIFDLDGLLTDTERLHRAAYRHALRRHGVELSDELYADHWIRAGKGIGDLVKELGLPIDPDMVRVEKAEEYRRLVRESVRPMPGAVEVLERLHGRKTIGLGSSSFADAVAAVIDTIGIRKYFSCITSGSDVKRAKPAPDIFLRAAELLKADPAECVVLEDAEKGVVAACAAGMKSIAVPNEYTRGHDFSKATRVVASLDDVTIPLIDSL